MLQSELVHCVQNVKKGILFSPKIYLLCVLYHFGHTVQ